VQFEVTTLNISPLKIENLLTNKEEIDQCMIYGDKKSYLVAIIVPGDNFLNNEQRIKIIINQINNELSVVEKVKKFFIIKEKFSIENGMLTPTLKLKRYKIIQKYKNNFEKLY